MRAKKIVIALVSVLAIMGITIGASNAFDAKAKTTYEDIEKFPDSYKSALYALKEKHPNWTFEVMETGLDWSTVVANEMNPDYRSLVPTYFDSKFVGRNYGDGWACATQEAVEYYLDPRNWLTEDYIFQFEKLTYNDGTQGIATVQKVLQNTFMSGYIQSDAQTNYEEMGLTYAQAFFDIGKSIRVSPVHLATRVKQEQGTQGTSDLISGVYPGYVGYYNYYNIQASGKTHEEIVRNGLNEAKSEGWNNRYAALIGGSQKLANRYILRGQDTLYLQKFDVDGQYDGRYWHQYMQNLAAPSNEGRNTKKAYESAGLLDEAFVFKIPVYKNMPGGDYENVKKYVAHLYNTVLERECSNHEMDWWIETILQNDLTCSQITYSFVFSDEYIANNSSDNEFVKMLYISLLDRIPQNSEVENWVNILYNDYSRKYVFQQFVQSDEFQNKCQDYKISSGSVVFSEDELYEYNCKSFVRRLYRLVLEREGESSDYSWWLDNISQNNLNGAQIVYGFVFSDENIQRNTDINSYIVMMYRVFLNREPAEEEINTWLEMLEGKYTRKYMFSQLETSTQFLELCKKYGIIDGNIAFSEDELYSYEDSNSQAEFIKQLYSNVLNRECSYSEVEWWVNQMNEYKMGASEVIYNFVFGPEYASYNVDNEEYISMLCRAALMRDSRSDDITYWENYLTGGFSRKYVFMQFTQSYEFEIMCQTYKLSAGGITLSEREIYDETINIKDCDNSELIVEDSNEIVAPENSSTTNRVDLGEENADIDTTEGSSLANENMTEDTEIDSEEISDSQEENESSINSEKNDEE